MDVFGGWLLAGLAITINGKLFGIKLPKSIGLVVLLKKYMGERGVQGRGGFNFLR